MINEHDMTKKMLDTLRISKLIVENNTPSEGIDLEQAELNEEQNKFREAISPRVDFETFKIYPQASNVIFAGKFQDMNGMSWQFSMTETKGVYIKADNLQLTEDTVRTIQKLSGYYDVWVKEWANKLATEYKKEMHG